MLISRSTKKYMLNLLQDYVSLRYHILLTTKVDSNDLVGCGRQYGQIIEIKALFDFLNTLE